ncbi:LytTR family DNA-binding domain-containing protein [soil metagenome]
MTIKCIIVDDEPLAQKGLAEYIRDIPFLDLLAVCDNANQARDYINNKAADLVFLDIEMPDFTGIDLLRSLTYKPAVIFTTAYQQYALQGYELDVVDYLMKPVSFERFLKAVNKAADFIRSKAPAAVAEEPDYFFIKVNYTTEKILYDEVLYIEALQNYIAIHLAKRKIVSYMTISSMMQQLPASLFMRIHKSYIAALNKINSLNGNKVIIQSSALPVSRKVKDMLLERIGNKLFKK